MSLYRGPRLRQYAILLQTVYYRLISQLQAKLAVNVAQIHERYVEKMAEWAWRNIKPGLATLSSNLQCRNKDSVVPEGALEEMGPRIDQKLTRADREAPKRSNFFSIGLTKQKTIRNKTSLSAKKTYLSKRETGGKFPSRFTNSIWHKNRLESFYRIYCALLPPLGGYVFTSIVCLLDSMIMWKLPIFTKEIRWKRGTWAKEKRLDFGGNPDHDTLKFRTGKGQGYA